MDTQMKEKFKELRHKQSILFTIQDTMFAISYADELEKQLGKYERIVNAAQYWCETRKGGKWFSEGGNKELVNMLKVREAREQALINAVNELTKA